MPKNPYYLIDFNLGYQDEVRRCQMRVDEAFAEQFTTTAAMLGELAVAIMLPITEQQLSTAFSKLTMYRPLDYAIMEEIAAVRRQQNGPQVHTLASRMLYSMTKPEYFHRWLPPIRSLVYLVAEENEVSASAANMLVTLAEAQTNWVDMPVERAAASLVATIDAAGFNLDDQTDRHRFLDAVCVASAALGASDAIRANSNLTERLQIAPIWLFGWASLISAVIYRCYRRPGSLVAYVRPASASDLADE